MMNVKEYLSQAYFKHQEIKRKRNKLETLRELATSTTSHISAMPRSGSPDPQRLEGIMAKVVDLEREIAEDEKDLAEARKRVADVIAEVSDTAQIQILMKRYLEFQDWDKIVVAIGKSKSWVMSQHRAALEVIQRQWAAHQA